MTNDPNRAAFDRIVNVLTEMATLRDDLAELKTEYLAELKTEYVETQVNPMPPETWGDLVALARLHVMDASARAKKETAEKRRKELSDQLDLGI